MYKALEEEKMTNDERRRMVGMRGNTNDKLNEYIKTREKGRKDNLKKMKHQEVGGRRNMFKRR